MLGIVFSTNSAHAVGDLRPPAQSPAPAVPSGNRKQRSRQRRLQKQRDQIADDRAAGYSRFSSDQQRESSNDDQKRRNRESALKNGHVIDPDLEFSDEAISGAKSERPGLDAMIAAAERKEFRVLYVFSLSRLARSLVITVPLLKRLVEVQKVRFICEAEGIDSDRQGWEYLAAFMAIACEHYLRDLRNNVRRGQEGAILDGYSVGDMCFGYSSEPVPGTAEQGRGRNQKPRMRYIINLIEAAWVKVIFEWFVRDRRSISWIVQELNRRNVPKGRRAQVTEWNRENVVGILENPKYVGTWAWGENRNERDPENGKITQVPVAPEESEQWTRHFPDLRLVDDDTFTSAQEILQANAEALALCRNDNGELRGSNPGAKFGNPTHLVSGLFECSECGHRLIISGSGSKFLRCRSYQRGLCNCKTQLPRQLAEQMILDVIGKRILSNPIWLNAVWTACQQHWRNYCDTVPAELLSVERQITDLDRRVGRLLDRIEDGDDSCDLAERLAERQSEKSDLVMKLKKLKADGAQAPDEPTEAWLRDQLTQLGETLQNGTPAAATALKALVGGKIVVERQLKPGKKSYFWQGRFTMNVRNVCGAIGAGMPPASDGCQVTNEEIVLNFVVLDDNEENIQRARELYEAEWLECDIGRELGVGRACITKYLKLSYAREGRELPDGRKRRHDLTKKTSGPLLAESNSENVKAFWDLDLPLQEICVKLDLNRDQVTAAIRFWFESRGLPVPDGRQRRKEIRLRKEC